MDEGMCEQQQSVYCIIINLNRNTVQHIQIQMVLMRIELLHLVLIYYLYFYVLQYIFYALTDEALQLQMDCDKRGQHTKQKKIKKIWI